MISDMVTPAFAADDTAALRTEWALKISVLIPDFVSVDFIHLAMVDDETGLYGRINAINRLNLLSSPLCSILICPECSYWAQKGIPRETWEEKLSD